MENTQSVRLQFLAIAITMIGTFIVCTLTLVYFFNLHWTIPDYPFFSSNFEQWFSIFRTALIATLLSSWAIWLGTKVRNKFSMTMLCAGVGTQLSMTLYAIAGCGGVLGGDWKFSELIFPSRFFTEFNFFTVMLEVAPVASIATGLLLYCSLKVFSPTNKIMQ